MTDKEFVLLRYPNAVEWNNFERGYGIRAHDLSYEIVSEFTSCPSAAWASAAERIRKAEEVKP